MGSHPAGPDGYGTCSVDEHLEPVIARLMIVSRDGKKDAVPHFAPKQD